MFPIPAPPTANNDPAGALVKTVLFALVLQQAAVNMAALLTQTDVYFLFKQFLGYDLVNAHRAARLFLAGSNPYQILNFVWLPPSLAVMLPLAELGEWEAAAAVFVANLVVVSGAVAGLAWAFGLRRLVFHLVLILWLYYPFYHVLDRGNLDGLVMALLVAALAFPRTQGVAGALLGLAAGLKAYPALLLGPLVIYRRWWTLAGVAAVGAILAIAFRETWMQVLEPLFRRATEVKPFPDGVSVFIPFYHLGQWLKGVAGVDWMQGLEQMALAFWLFTLATALLADIRYRRKPEGRGLACHLFLYVPWMTTFPLTVFAYTLIQCIPLLAAVAVIAADVRRLPGRPLFVTGWVLSGFQSWAWFSLTGLEAVRPLNAVGMLLLMLWVPWCKWRLRS